MYKYLSKLSIFFLPVTGIPFYLLPATAETKCVNYWVNPTTGNQECLRSIRGRSTRKIQRNDQQKIINPARNGRKKYITIPNRYENDRVNKTERKSNELNHQRKNFDSRYRQHSTWPLGYENDYLIQPRVEINIDGYYVIPREWKRRRFKRDFRRRRYNHHYHTHPNYYPNNSSFNSQFHHRNYPNNRLNQNSHPNNSSFNSQFDYGNFQKNRLNRNSYPNNSSFNSRFNHRNYPQKRFTNQRDFYRD